jgi:hypothetical protein
VQNLSLIAETSLYKINLDIKAKWIDYSKAAYTWKNMDFAFMKSFFEKRN